MSWSAVGSSVGVTATTFTLAPGGSGHLVILQVQNSSATVYCTGASSTNATWVQQGGVYLGYNNTRSVVTFFGTTSSTSSATVTLTFSGTVGTIRGVAQEFSSTVGSWSLSSLGLLDMAAGQSNWAPCMDGSILVQKTTVTATSGSSITATLPNSTTAGNSLIACWGGVTASGNPQISGITLGGSADNWASAETAYNSSAQNSAIWTDVSCASGQTSVVVSSTGGVGTSPGQTLSVFEWKGLAASPVDQISSATGNSTAISSGATPTLSQAAEIAFGALSGLGTVTGPGLQWAPSNTILVSGVIESNASYLDVDATTALTYAGTLASANKWGACIATLKLANAPASGDLYFGYAINSGTPIAGSTGGYSWTVNSDGHNNGMAYNLNVSAGSTAPVWGDTGQEFGMMVMVKESSTASFIAPKPYTILQAVNRAAVW